MMIISRKFFLAFVATVVAQSFVVFTVVDGAANCDVRVQCLPEEPDVCVGELYTITPITVLQCNDPDDPYSCESVDIGGYSWEYVFVEGLLEGTRNPATIAAAKTGVSIMVTVDDDVTCNVSIGDETCSVCSLEGCSPTKPVTIKYDCTNVDNGRESLDECVPLVEPFFYPLRLALEEALDTVAGDGDTDAEPEIGAADADAETGTNNTDTNAGESETIDTAGDSVNAAESSSATYSFSRVIMDREMGLSLLLFSTLCWNL